jgi:hypothetical protein
MEQNSLNTQITKENKNADFSEMLEYESSNYETLNASIKGQSQYSKNSINSNTILFPLFSPNLYNKLDFKKDQLKFFSKQNILFSFTNQKSTKQLQKSLVGISKDIIDFIIYELTGCFRMIIRDKNGNYFCSDLLKICYKNQRIKILKELSNTINEDCTDEFGTHTIQNLIEFASSEEEFKLLLVSFNDFNKITVTALNQYGTHVIQKLIVHIPEKFRMVFNLMFVKFVLVLSRDMYGVCAVKKFIAYTKNEVILKQFLNLVLTNFINISGNKYGNYLIQYLLEKWWKKEEGISLKNIIISKFPILAENRYSSYVCSLFIKLCNDEEKKQLLVSLNKHKNKNKNNNANSTILVYINEINNSMKFSNNKNNESIDNSNEQ